MWWPPWSRDRLAGGLVERPAQSPGERGYYSFWSVVERSKPAEQHGGAQGPVGEHQAAFFHPQRQGVGAMVGTFDPKAVGIEQVEDRHFGPVRQHEADDVARAKAKAKECRRNFSGADA